MIDYKNILGWMTEQDLLAIEKIAKTLPENAVIVEVGSMFGRSAVCWAQHSPKTSNIYCIDTWDTEYTPKHSIIELNCMLHKFPLNGKQYNLFSEFTNNTKSFNNIKMIRGYCPRETAWSGIPIDLLFLDASHLNPNDWEILEYFMPFIKENGIISGHDYEKEEFPDVVENVSKLENMFNKKVKLFEYSSVWMIKK